MITPIKMLGSLGAKLPVLKEEEWHHIFEVLEFYLTTEKVVNSRNYDDAFDWKKVKEILMLLNKIE